MNVSEILQGHRLASVYCGRVIRAASIGAQMEERLSLMSSRSFIAAIVFVHVLAGGALAWRLAGASAWAAEPQQAERASGFKIGRETTYITGPINVDGSIDYETALNQALSRGIAPEQNANRLLWNALGPQPEGAAVLPALFVWLKMPAPSQQG